MRDELGNNIHCVDKIGDRTGIPFYLPIRLRIYNAIYFDCKNYLWEVKIYRMDFQKFFYIFTIHIRNVSEKFARYTIEYKIYSTWSSSSSSRLVKRFYYPSLLSLFFLASIFLFAITLNPVEEKEGEAIVEGWFILIAWFRGWKQS